MHYFECIWKDNHNLISKSSSNVMSILILFQRYCQKCPDPDCKPKRTLRRELVNSINQTHDIILSTNLETVLKGLCALMKGCTRSKCIDCIPRWYKIIHCIYELTKKTYTTGRESVLKGWNQYCSNRTRTNSNRTRPSVESPEKST